MSNERYLEAMDRVIAAAEAKRAIPSCRDCRYRVNDVKWRSDGCRNPLVQLATVVASENSLYAHMIGRCTQQRLPMSSYGEVVCGPDGLLFEPKQEQDAWWWPVGLASVGFALGVLVFLMML